MGDEGSEGGASCDANRHRPGLCAVEDAPEGVLRSRHHLRCYEHLEPAQGQSSCEGFCDGSRRGAEGEGQRSRADE
eukprot:9969621-Heterocapsa_arctica.AAC.1